MRHNLNLQLVTYGKNPYDPFSSFTFPVLPVIDPYTYRYVMLRQRTDIVEKLTLLRLVIQWIKWNVVRPYNKMRAVVWWWQFCFQQTTELWSACSVHWRAELDEIFSLSSHHSFMAHVHSVPCIPWQLAPFTWSMLR